MLSKKSCFKFSKSGFSLIETLLVASLIPIVSFAIYVNFSSGMKLWKTAAQDIAEEDISIFRLKTTRDFENILNFSPLPPYGDSGQFVIAGRLHTDVSLGGNRGICQIRFYYDPDHKTLVKEEKNIHEFENDLPGKSKVYLKNVESLILSFFTYDADSKSYSWQNEWSVDKKSLPIAVRYKFKTKSSDDFETLTFKVRMSL